MADKSRSANMTIAGLLAFGVLLATGGFLLHSMLSEDDAPTPVITETTTVSPSPTFTQAEDGYEIAYTIITGVWQEKTKADQATICKGWDILPHNTVLDELESGLKGANEKIGVTDRQYRKAATDFFNREC